MREDFRSSVFYSERKIVASLDDLSLIHEDEISVPVSVLRLRAGEKNSSLFYCFQPANEGAVAAGAAVDVGSL